MLSPLHGRCWGLTVVYSRRLTAAAVAGGVRDRAGLTAVAAECLSAGSLAHSPADKRWSGVSQGSRGGTSTHTSVEPIIMKGQVQGAGSACQSAYPNKTGVWIVIATHYGGTAAHWSWASGSHSDRAAFYTTPQQQLISLLNLTRLHINQHQIENRTQISATITWMEI